MSCAPVVQLPSDPASPPAVGRIPGPIWVFEIAIWKSLIAKEKLKKSDLIIGWRIQQIANKIMRLIGHFRLTVN